LARTSAKAKSARRGSSISPLSGGPSPWPPPFALASSTAVGRMVPDEKWGESSGGFIAAPSEPGVYRDAGRESSPGGSPLATVPAGGHRPRPSKHTLRTVLPRPWPPPLFLTSNGLIPARRRSSSTADRDAVWQALVHRPSASPRTPSPGRRPRHLDFLRKAVVSRGVARSAALLRPRIKGPLRHHHGFRTGSPLHAGLGPQKGRPARVSSFLLATRSNSFGPPGVYNFPTSSGQPSGDGHPWHNACGFGRLFAGRGVLYLTGPGSPRPLIRKKPATTWAAFANLLASCRRALHHPLSP